MMASNPTDDGLTSRSTETTLRHYTDSLADGIGKVFALLTSLKLTVALLAMAIFIVLAGTLAQVDKGIWQVTAEYFRTPIAWIDLRIFFPPHWFPSLAGIRGGFYFPGGWLIGFLLAINLMSTYIVHTPFTAHGPRLVGGVALTGLGALMTWLVIASASGEGVVGTLPAMPWSMLWILLKVGLTGLWLAALYGLRRVDRTRRLEWWLLLAAAVALGGLTGWLWYAGANAMNVSSLRILWQLIKGGLASLVLLGGCLLLFQKRAGIILIHAGILLMMLGELLVGTQAIEGHMRIQEGQTLNYVEEARSLELVVIDPSAAATDLVVAIPVTRLRPGATIHHARLPFDVKVLKYLSNSRLRPAVAGAPNLATAGTGLESIAEAKPPVSGTGNEMNLASAYIELLDKGNQKSLGIYLVGQAPAYNGIYETVSRDGKTYQIMLRPTRDYKPYSIHLVDFRFDKYIGTSKARNYSSDIRLVDPSRGVDRRVRIWMNNPLRYAGETFYQSGFETDRPSGTEVTILQVVSNAGWMIPYVACMMVATGMLTQFGIGLLGFLRARSAGETADANPAGRRRRKDRRGPLAAAWFPLLVVASAVLLLGSIAKPPRAPAGQMHLYQCGKLPLAYEGRIKPLDTLARNSLAIISGRQTYKDPSGNRQPAIRWLLDLIAATDRANETPVFRIENLEVLQTLGLKRRPGFRYSMNEIRPHASDFSKQVQLARAQKKEKRTIYQRKILELAAKVQRCRLLGEAFFPTPIRPAHAAEDIAAAQRYAEQVAQYQPPLAVPVVGSADKTWQSFAAAWAAVHRDKLHGVPPNRAAVLLSNMLGAYRLGNVDRFNAAVAQYERLLISDPPPLFNPTRVGAEAWFNHCQPFFWCALLYLLAFVLAALAWLGWSGPLNRAAFWLIAVTFVVHTAALVARIYISGRPPVTNLYSSAIFIGWGCVVLGLLIELIYRLGVGNVLAAVAGFTTLLIALLLSRQGDTFVVLQAVLDTQFWLATHVTCITLGYSTTFVAGCLGILYVIRGVLTPSLSPRVGQELGRMIYGAVCFALLFSFVGTVLGGLWADDSWGRFWGWDPKENGALIIVLWNALMLHARWDGMVKDRGFAVLAIVGNICTAWSWFGVNELGVGLHSYGFTEGVLLGLGIFCLTQLAVIALGLLPQRLWWSNRVRTSRGEATP